MGGWAECPACADTGARTPIGASGNWWLFKIESIQKILEPNLEPGEDSCFKDMLEKAKNAKLYLENPSNQTFKSEEEDSYSDLDYENLPDYYWEMEYETADTDWSKSSDIWNYKLMYLCIYRFLGNWFYAIALEGGWFF